MPPQPVRDAAPVFSRPRPHSQRRGDDCAAGVDELEEQPAGGLVLVTLADAVSERAVQGGGHHGELETSSILSGTAADRASIWKRSLACAMALSISMRRA